MFDRSYICKNKEKQTKTVWECDRVSRKSLGGSYWWFSLSRGTMNVTLYLILYLYHIFRIFDVYQAL